MHINVALLLLRINTRSEVLNSTCHFLGTIHLCSNKLMMILINKIMYNAYGVVQYRSIMLQKSSQLKFCDTNIYHYDYLLCSSTCGTTCNYDSVITISFNKYFTKHYPSKLKIYLEDPSNPRCYQIELIKIRIIK